MKNAYELPGNLSMVNKLTPSPMFPGEFRIQGPTGPLLAGSLKPLPAAFAAGNFLKTRYRGPKSADQREDEAFGDKMCRLPESNRDEVAPTGF